MKAWERVEQIHLATLDALSRVLSVDESVVLQGGTGLHLAHGSPRYSEDMDFLVAASPVDGASTLSWLEARMDQVAQVVSASTVRRLGQPTRLHAPEANRRGRNPVTFELRVPAARRSERATVVKCEFYHVAPQLLAHYGAKMKPLRSTVLPAVTAVVEVADAPEIVIDKIHALGLRRYVKHRDVFDLWWLRDVVAKPAAAWFAEQVPVHAAMYQAEDDSRVLESARTRLASIDPIAMRAELERYVPGSLLGNENLARMVEACHAWIDDVEEALGLGSQNRAGPGVG